VRVIGVEPTDADAMSRSLRAGRRVVLAHVGLFADGVAVRQVGKETFRLARQFVDEIVRVDTDEMCAAIKDVFEDTRAVLEPAGALAVAGAKAWVERRGVRGKTLVAIASGANTNFDRLRFVAERAEMGEHREAVLAVTIPERRGSFRRFCSVLGGRNITEFNYRMSDPKEAHIFVGVTVHDRDETSADRSHPAARGLRHARSFGRRGREGAHAAHGRRAFAARAQRAALPVRVPRAPGRADAVPLGDEPELEHQPVQLPQPRRRLWQHPRRHPGAAAGDGRFPHVPAPRRLPACRRDAQPAYRLFLG
jgi:hypothetical protein